VREAGLTLIRQLKSIPIKGSRWPRQNVAFQKNPSMLLRGGFYAVGNLWLGLVCAKVRFRYPIEITLYDDVPFVIFDNHEIIMRDSCSSEQQWISICLVCLLAD